MTFHCLDVVGHAGVLVEFRSVPPDDKSSHTETAKFFVPLEAVAVDGFVLRLREVVSEVADQT